MIRRRVVALLAAGAVLAACGSGESILQAGNDPPPTAATVTTVSAPTVTARAGETVPSVAPTTAAPTTIATTTTTPLDALPRCPVDALDDVTSPVDVTFWHGLGSTPEERLVELTNEYNAGQDKVRVTLQNQGGYRQTIDKYVQSGQGSRPELVMMPEYMLAQTADSDTVVPVGACIEASGFDTAPFLPRILGAYATRGVQWAMPFNVSGPVLYYVKPLFAQAGLDPDDPPVSLEELRAAAEAIVGSGAAGVGVALDSGVDSGGGWFLEQWFARAGELYADGNNGRSARATRVLYDNATGVELMTFLQTMVNEGLAVSVGDNPQGQDTLLKLADVADPAAMTIASSAGLGTVLSVLDGGLIPGVTSADVGVGPMPGPGPDPSAIVGGAALYVVAGKGDAQAAAAWDYIQFLVSAESQAKWAPATGYVPIRADALELEPVKSVYTADPRFRVAYDQLVARADDAAAVGPVIGPLREVRAVTASAVASIFGGADVASALSGAAAQASALIADYNSRN